MMAKSKGPTEAQIEAARKLQQSKAPVIEKAPAPPADNPDPDPQPVAPSWSGKDEDFPAWLQADMRHKEALGAWLARRKK